MENKNRRELKTQWKICKTQKYHNSGTTDMYKDKTTELEIKLWEKQKKINTLENKEIAMENYCRIKKLEMSGCESKHKKISDSLRY